MTTIPARGEIWWCEEPTVGRRPVVVLSREQSIPVRRRTLIAPCTTNVRGLASQVVLEPGDDPVARRCAVNLDSVQTVPVALLTDRLGRLSSARMHEVCAALAAAAGCQS